MFAQFFAIRPFSALCIVTACLLTVGCQSLPPVSNGGQQNLIQQTAYTDSAAVDPAANGAMATPPELRPPTEMSRASLPAHRLGPSDIVLIDAIRTAPKGPYVIHTMDVLQIQADGLPEDQPLIGTYQVMPGGMVDLGPNYGTVILKDKTVPEARSSIEQHLQKVGLAQPTVSVTMIQVSGIQAIQGEHLVTPDGTVILGMYGRVYVAGLTVDEARDAIEQHLSQFLETPIISFSIFAYNSKKIYVIVKGAGFGDQHFTIASTGNDTVLDAIGMIRGTQRVSDKNRIYVARPTPSGAGYRQKLPVDYDAIIEGETDTNWQLFPGDRLVIESDRLIELDSLVQKVTAPFERILGFSLLGSQTIQNLQRFPGVQIQQRF